MFRSVYFAVKHIQARSFQAALLACFILLPIQQAKAELKLSGYGTIGYVEDDVSGTAFVRELVQKPELKDPNTFRSETRPFLTDSRLGLQAVYLNKRWARNENDQTAVSPAIWDKYNNLSNTCSGCHRSFRGPSW